MVSCFVCDSRNFLGDNCHFGGEALYAILHYNSSFPVSLSLSSTCLDVASDSSDLLLNDLDVTLAGGFLGGGSLGFGFLGGSSLLGRGFLGGFSFSGSLSILKFLL